MKTSFSSKRLCAHSTSAVIILRGFGTVFRWIASTCLILG